MAPMNGYTTTPHHRQNRRRERPGSRTRRTITRKANISLECTEGLLDAYDEVSLPSERIRPSPLMRQNFDQSWQRWKARQAEEKTLTEMGILQLEDEQRRLFGGDVGDDELYRLGILYKENDEDVARDVELNTVSCDVPVEHSFPMFVIRHGKPRRSRRRITARSLPPLYMSFATLSDDVDIAHFLSHSNASMPKTKHYDSIESTPPGPVSIPLPTDIDIPQSLPPPSAFEMESIYGSGSSIISSDNTPVQISLPAPQTSLHNQQGEWTFVNITLRHNTTIVETPISEPETWILIDDS